jgi:N-acetylglutamate synthase-like GNAT family acetyltransferase
MHIKGLYMWHSQNSPDCFSDGLQDRASAIARVKMRVRSYDARDRHEVLRLYHHGLLTGTPDPRDPATDLDHIGKNYLKRSQDHFWVAEMNGRIVGTVAIKGEEDQIAHVRRLRVDPAWNMWHNGEIARVLIQTATYHAHQHDYLKLVLHTPVDDHWAIMFFHQMGFDYARARELQGRHLLEFYLNLYVRPDQRIFDNEELV